MFWSDTFHRFLQDTERRTFTKLQCLLQNNTPSSLLIKRQSLQDLGQACFDRFRRTQK